MTALAIELAPPTARPWRFLATTLLWGVVAGVLLLAYGEAVLVTRWSPVTVALVHAFTLGILGNAMLGSLLQFLPVVLGMRVPLERHAALLHAGYNLGIVLLLAGLAGGWRGLLPPAALLLAATLGGFALLVLAAILRAGVLKPLPLGIGAALLCLALTVAAGVAIAGAMAGSWALALDRWTDVHAILGVGGWVLLLTASVGCVTVPMFQGTRAVPARVVGAWLCAVAVALPGATVLRWLGHDGTIVGLLASLPIVSFALAVLVLQRGAPHRRNPGLVRFWRWGCLALVVASLLVVAAPVLADAPVALLAGVLALGVGFPLLVVGMLLEIVAFLGWIRLHRACGRGVRLPGVDALLPERDKCAVLMVHGVAAALLVAAAARPVDLLVRAAGATLAVAYLAAFALVLGVSLRSGRFLKHLRKHP